MMNVTEARRALTGPVASIRTPFKPGGDIDFDGLRRQIDHNIDVAKSPVALLTAGDSHYECMTDDEMAQMAKATVEHVAGRVPVVACDWQFGQAQAVKFAAYCSDIGVDILMTRPADWANSGSVETQVDFFRAVAKEIPVMIVTNLWAQRPDFGLKVLAAMRDVEGVIAIKEDLQGEFARKMCMICHEKWAVFAGGGLRNHQNMLPYGCDGFMDRHMNFKPDISHRYWHAVQANDRDDALAVMKGIELPLEDFCATFPGGRDAAIHGLMELFDVCPRWRRLPYHSLTDAEMDRLRGWCAERGWV